MNPKQIIPPKKFPSSLLLTETPPASPECNSNLPLALLHLTSLAPSRVEYDGMNIYCESWLWWAAWKGWRKNKKWGKSWCRHFWPDWRSSLQQVIHSEREAQVPLLPLPAQVYDNPNKLWCAAQTLKTLIGTKSNSLCLSGQRELRERLCVCSSPLSIPTINFSPSSNLTSLQVHLPISLSSIFLSAPIFWLNL